MGLRPISFQNRPISFQNRPVSFQNRPISFQNLVDLSEKLRFHSDRLVNFFSDLSIYFTKLYYNLVDSTTILVTFH